MRLKIVRKHNNNNNKLFGTSPIESDAVQYDSAAQFYILFGTNFRNHGWKFEKY
jgi:hypothetical protein